MKRVRECRPLIHCITNYVTAGNVADMLLAAGASPVMADGMRDAKDAAECSDGLVLNLGTLDERRAETMLLAGKKTAARGCPVVLDPVGAGTFPFRLETAVRILREIPCAAIRGNASEIRAVAKAMGCGETSGRKEKQGVDASFADRLTEDNRYASVAMAKALSRATGAAVIMTGAEDLIVDGLSVCIVENGSPMMSRVTGTGCMMDGILAAFLAAYAGSLSRFSVLVKAVCAMGICGEAAAEETEKQDAGTGSFKMLLIDAMSLLTDKTIEKWKRIRMEKPKLQLKVYAVTDRSWTGEKTLFQQVEEALKAGAIMVQLREKNMDQEALLAEAREIKKLTDAYGVPLIINDNVQAALACGAAGVHVGQSDGNPEEVRRMIGPGMILGVTAKTVEQAKQAEAAGADYLGSGAVFGSSTKKDAKPMSMELLRAITGAVRIPVAAIGGIHPENADQLCGTGIAGLAVVSGIFGARDIEAAVRSLSRSADRIIAAGRQDLPENSFRKAEETEHL